MTTLRTPDRYGSDDNSLGIRGRRRSRNRNTLITIRSSSLFLLGCTAMFFHRTYAFPQDSLGWIAAAQRPAAYTRPELTKPTPQYCNSALPVLQKRLERTLLELSRGRSNEAPDDNQNDNSNSKSEKNENFPRFGKKEGRRFRSSPVGRGFAPRRGGANATTAVMDAPSSVTSAPSDREIEMAKRMTQLEHLVAKQTVEIRRLQEECRKLNEVSETFANVVELLRAAGLQTDDVPPSSDIPSLTEERRQQASYDGSADIDTISNDDIAEEIMADEDITYEYFDDAEIFGAAPSSVIDAADAAGAAILAGLLGGKQRMLVDVRDSELSRDPETLVQFIELAILPVAAGLEGLRSNRNRVKIVFPTVSQLLEYRRTMALAAPEVVALSTLGFDPVEERDNIVVIVAPPPDSEEGLQAMNDLLNPANEDWQISQPVVVLNHHMVPLSGPAAEFEVMYHLRLLSVQYMSGDKADDIFQKYEDGRSSEGMTAANMTANDSEKPDDDEILEEAMKHAHEAGVNHGMTRAMVIRAYPKPWHVFVDVSPATDADFVVAATFDDEPGTDQVHGAIVECLEGSEAEDELVAQQMQQALDMKNGKLDLNGKFDLRNQTEISNIDNLDDDDEEDDDDWYDLWNEDSI